MIKSYLYAASDCIKVKKRRNQMHYAKEIFENAGKKHISKQKYFLSSAPINGKCSEKSKQSQFFKVIKKKENLKM